MAEIVKLIYEIGCGFEVSPTWLVLIGLTIGLTVMFIKLFLKECWYWKTGNFSISGLKKDIKVELLTVIVALLLFLPSILLLRILSMCNIFIPVVYLLILQYFIPITNYLGQFGAKVDYIITFYEKTAEKIKDKFID